jgi:hypothetical protein
MNQNHIITDRWSNADSERLYRAGWPDEPALKRKYEQGRQCGECSHYGEFNADYGLCCCSKSRHFTETVFEHFTCPSFFSPSWPDLDVVPTEQELKALYEILSRSYDTGCHDVAERHNELDP